MARIARIIAPGIPHHITQRGNRRMQTFFCDQDYQEYINLLAQWCRRCNVAVWAYCLMPNHVHIIAVPDSESGLRQAIGETHRRYTCMINVREGWQGHLWQGRFASFPMDERHLLAAVHYVEMNPVRARLAADPLSWRWSSALAHVSGEDDALVIVSPLLDMVGDWREFLATEYGKEELEEVRRKEKTGRPLGEDAFVSKIEQLLDRPLHMQKRGPKGKKHSE
jgi:putative transposase